MSDLKKQNEILRQLLKVLTIDFFTKEELSKHSGYSIPMLNKIISNNSSYFNKIQGNNKIGEKTKFRVSALKLSELRNKINKKIIEPSINVKPSAYSRKEDDCIESIRAILQIRHRDASSLIHKLQGLGLVKIEKIKNKVIVKANTDNFEKIMNEQLKPYNEVTEKINHYIEKQGGDNK